MATNLKLLRCPTTFFAVTLAILLLLPSALARAATGNPKLPKASCRIEIDNAHMSSSILKHRKTRNVKINARSICNVPQQRVTLTVEIHKTGIFDSHLVRRFQTDENSPKSSGLRVEIKNAAVKCLNSKTTNYFGIAYSKAIIQGKWQYAGRTQSSSIVPLKCGT